MELFLFMAIVFLIVISFVLGRHWEAFCIRNSIAETGVAISKWGHGSKIKIVGTVEDFEA